jgi:small subunit ribosomal protein S3Ae
VYPQGADQEIVRPLVINYIISISSISESIGKQIQKETSKIFPLQNVIVRKVKVLKKPKFDLTKLMELYQDKPEKKAAAADEPKNSLQATK